MIREWNKCGQSLILEHGEHWSNNWQARNQFVSEIETFYRVLILKNYVSFPFFSQYYDYLEIIIYATR